MTHESARPLRERRWPWLISAILLLISAGVGGWSTYLYWLDCQGGMLDGTIFDDNRRASAMPHACFPRMDGGMPFLPNGRAGPAQGAAASAAVSLLLASMAWVPLLLGLRWSPRTRYAAAVPGAVALLLLGTALIGETVFGQPQDALLGGAVHILALLGLVAAAYVYTEDRSRWAVVRLVLLASAAGGFRAVQLYFDYAFMMSVSTVNWDVPPGTGYLTILALAVAALGVAVITVSRRFGT